MLRIANHILEENFIPSGKKNVEYGQTLLFMLRGRSQRNIEQPELDHIEKSGSFDDFSGFFKGTVKDLFEAILDHFVFCIKKKACSQKDAEVLLTKSVVNFACTEIEVSFIQSYTRDALSRALRATETPRHSESSSTNPRKEKKKDTSMNQKSDLFDPKKQMKMRQSKRSSSRQKASTAKAAEFDDDEIMDI